MQTLDMQNPNDAATVGEALKRGGYLSIGGERYYHESHVLPPDPPRRLPLWSRLARGLHRLAIITALIVAIAGYGATCWAPAPAKANPFAEFGGYYAPVQNAAAPGNNDPLDSLGVPASSAVAVSQMGSEVFQPWTALRIGVICGVVAFLGIEIIFGTVIWVIRGFVDPA